MYPACPNIRFRNLAPYKRSKEKVKRCIERRGRGKCRVYHEEKKRPAYISELTKVDDILITIKKKKSELRHGIVYFKQELTGSPKIIEFRT